MRRSLACIIVALGACEDAATSSADLLPRAECVIAVVASDYRSSSTVSLLASDGRPCATDVVHSGSRPPGLLTALSGDVVLPTSAPAPDSDHDLVIIDRYPNGIVTRLDATAADVPVRSQLAVAPGFAGNPQDILFLDASTALVSRLERDPAAVADPVGASIDPADGSDVLVINWIDGTRRARIALDDAADPGFDPMPSRLTRTDAMVWAGLAHLSARFDAAGPGRVALIDPDAHSLVATVALDAWSNCGQVDAAPDGSGVWVVCSGQFARAGDAQLARSGLAWIDAATRTVTWSRGADVLAAAPLSFSLAALDDQRALVVAVGDLTTSRPDRLLLVTRASDAPLTLLESGAFELGALLPSPAAGLVLVAVGDPRDPRIARLRLSDFGAESAITGYSTTGLPPRALTFFR